MIKIAGGTGVAGKWMIILSLYFFFLISLVTYISNLDNNITYSGDGFINSPTGLNLDIETAYDEYEGETECNYPRYFYNSDLELIRNPYPFTKKCQYTLGVYDEETCESINGCEWNTTTTGGFLGFGGEDITTCVGEVNTAYYNNDTSTSFICDMVGLQQIENKSTCEILGCTFITDIGTSLTDRSIQEAKEKGLDLNTLQFKDNFLSTFRKMLTFQTDIGLPDGYNYLFNFLFFYIPLLAMFLIVAMYVRG